MKKNNSLFSILICLMPVLVFGQKDSLRLSFTALSGGQHIALDSVFIENLSQGGDTLLAAPDTVLWLFWESSGMAEAGTKSLQAQVYPNPFAGSTKLTVFLPREGPVNITAYDMLGRQKLIIHSGTAPVCTASPLWVAAHKLTCWPCITKTNDRCLKCCKKTVIQSARA